MSTYESNIQENGSITYKFGLDSPKIEIALLSQAHLDRDFSKYYKHIYYTAKGRDKDGNWYTVTWDIINEDAEEEEDACDWDDYEVTLHYRDTWEDNYKIQKEELSDEILDDMSS